MTKYFIGLFIAFTVLSCKKDDSQDQVIDKVRIALSTSLAAYDAAATNTWIKITSAEYNNLLITVNGAAVYATPEIYMNTIPENGWSANYTIGGSNNALKVPASSYIIAWSVKNGTNTGSSLNSKLKISASQKTGYTDYGSPLPDIGAIAANTRVYFLLKTPNFTTPASPSYTAVYNYSAYFLGNIGTPSSGPEFYTAGDSPSPSTTYASDSYSQVIGTQTKQW